MNDPQAIPGFRKVAMRRAWKTPSPQNQTHNAMWIPRSSTLSCAPSTVCSIPCVVYSRGKWTSSYYRPLVSKLCLAKMKSQVCAHLLVDKTSSQIRSLAFQVGHTQGLRVSSVYKHWVVHVSTWRALLELLRLHDDQHVVLVGWPAVNAG